MVNAILGAGSRSQREVHVSALVGCLAMLMTGGVAAFSPFSPTPWPGCITPHNADAGPGRSR
jgi:hypothetical protein